MVRRWPQVPWARHGAGHTRDFDDQVAWLATHVLEVGGGRVDADRLAHGRGDRGPGPADIDARVDRLAGLRRIGIDEISYKRGHQYLTVVVDHDTGRLVWAAPGRDDATLRRFFDLLGAERAAADHPVSAPTRATGSPTWSGRRCPNAVRCADPFHVVAWATDALDVGPPPGLERRPAAPPTRRRAGRRASRAMPAALKRARYALWKNPENLTAPPTPPARLDRQDRPPTVPRLPTQRRTAPVFTRQRRRRQSRPRPLDPVGPTLPHPAFVELQRRIVNHRAAIDAALDTGLSNALDRVDQHQDPAAHPHRLRLPRTRTPHRPRHAQPRRPPPRPPRPNMTHGSSRTARYRECG